MRDQHFFRLSSVLPVASSRRTASTWKVEYFCAIIQYLCEMKWCLSIFISALKWFFFFLEVYAVPLHEMRIVQNWISFRFLGSYSFEDNWSGDWGAALKRVLLSFPLETTSYLCSEVFFKAFCWQGMQKILKLLNSVFTVPSSIVSPRGQSTVCFPPYLFQSVLHLGWRCVFELIGSYGQTLQATGGFLLFSKNTQTVLNIWG